MAGRAVDVYHWSICQKVVLLVILFRVRFKSFVGKAFYAV